MLPNMKTDNPLSCAAHCDLAERDGGGGPGGAGGQAAHPHPGQRLLGPRQLQGAGGGQQGAHLPPTLASRRRTPTPSCCSHRREPGRRSSPNTSRISLAKLCLSVSAPWTFLQRVTVPLSGISCAYVGDILLQGHLYVTDNYLAFHSNVFGYVTKVGRVPRDGAV